MLWQNNLLVEIAEKLGEVKPDWEEVVEKFKETYIYKNRKYDGAALCGKLAEMHIRISLEKIVDELEANHRVEFNPINSSKKTGNYEFYYDKNEDLYVREIASSEDRSELDELLLIDCIPVLFEIKIGEYIGTSSSW